MKANDIHPCEISDRNVRTIIGWEKSSVAFAANINYRRLLQHQDKQNELHLSEKEKQFLQLACSDATYKQIASTMNVSERTVDGYRENLFRKLDVQSRTGMALEAIRRNLVTL